MVIQKIVKIVALVLGLIAVFFLVRIMMIGDEAIEADVANQSVLSNFAMLAYIVLAIATIAAVLFSLINLVSNPVKLKRALLSFGVFAAVLALAFVLASGEARQLSDGSTLSATQSRIVEAGIYAFYILIVVAAGLMLVFGIKKMLSK